MGVEEVGEAEPGPAWELSRGWRQVYGWQPGPSWRPWVVLLYPVVWCLAWGDQELAPAPHLLLEQGQGVVRGPGAT